MLIVLSNVPGVALTMWCKKSLVNDDWSASNAEEEGRVLIEEERSRRCAAYLRALVDGDGDAAAALFSSQGVLDDLMGGQHIGRARIKAFICARPPLTLDESLHMVTFPDCINFYGRIHFDDGVVMKVRWTFSFEGLDMAHLCTSRVHSHLGVDSESGASGPAAA